MVGLGGDNIVDGVRRVWLLDGLGGDGVGDGDGRVLSARFLTEIGLMRARNRSIYQTTFPFIQPPAGRKHAPKSSNHVSKECQGL